jgi:hypothetical protein
MNNAWIYIFRAQIIPQLENISTAYFNKRQRKCADWRVTAEYLFADKKSP